MLQWAETASQTRTIRTWNEGWQDIHDDGDRPVLIVIRMRLPLLASRRLASLPKRSDGTGRSSEGHGQSHEFASTARRKLTFRTADGLADCPRSSLSSMKISKPDNQRRLKSPAGRGSKKLLLSSSVLRSPDSEGAIILKFGRRRGLVETSSDREHFIYHRTHCRPWSSHRLPGPRGRNDGRLDHSGDAAI